MVDHALASPAAYALGVRLQVEDPFLDLSDHGILRVQLPASASQPPARPASTGARVVVRGEPGSERAWAQYLERPECLDAVQAALQLGDPDAEAAALESVLLEACAALDLTRHARPHKPN